MLISTNLLKRFISLTIDSQHLMSEMTLHACEVEDVTTRILPDLLVIGYVKETKKHPNADTLTICQVDCGVHGTYQICTAADNITHDIFVPVSLPGCYLPAIDVTIAERKMRGETSNGMICAKIELGIDEDANVHGIWILDEDFDDLTSSDCGMALSTKYPWLNNTILDIDNKTINNRPDLTGLLGMAIEMKSVFDSTVRGVSFENETSKGSSASSAKSSVIKHHTIDQFLRDHSPAHTLQILAHARPARQNIRIETEYCNIYSLVQLDDVTVHQSPFLDRLALIDSGLGHKNNRVDFSNLFMMLTGQPIHVFDADTIVGTVVVRQATEEEKFVDLLGNTHLLTNEDIVIADDEKILALAGVIGGLSSAVTQETRNVVIEIAHFDAVMVRRTSMRIGLRTDAVMRFEKAPSSLLALTSLSIILDFLKEYKTLLGDYQLVGIATSYEESLATKAYQPLTISIDPVQCMRLLFGIPYEENLHKSTLIRILSSLGFEVKNDWAVTVPWWRGEDDITLAEDIYEEFIRIYGYDRIQPRKLTSPMAYQNYLPLVHTLREMEQTLTTTFHAHQLQSYPWIDEKYLKIFEISENDLVRLRNATAPELSYLRPSMLPNLVEFVRKNSKVYDHFTLYDHGQTRNKKEHYSRYLSKQSFETTKLGIILYDKTIASRKEDGLLRLKQIIELMQSQSGLLGTIVYRPTHINYFHPKKQGEIILKLPASNSHSTNHASTTSEILLGIVGQYHPQALEALKIDPQASLVAGELYVESWTDILRRQTKSFESRKDYLTIQDQIVSRDINFIVERSMNLELLTQLIERNSDVIDYDIVDVYVGERLGTDKRSVVYSLSIRGDGKWTSDQFSAVVDTIVLQAKKLGATIG